MSKYSPFKCINRRLDDLRVQRFKLECSRDFAKDIAREVTARGDQVKWTNHFLFIINGDEGPMPAISINDALPNKTFILRPVT